MPRPARPCANCEDKPVQDPTGKVGDPLFCGSQCRAEFEGDDEN